MSSFWPEDLQLTDIQSPRGILEVAQEDWQVRSDGVMELIPSELRKKLSDTFNLGSIKSVIPNLVSMSLKDPNGTIGASMKSTE